MRTLPCSIRAAGLLLMATGSAEQFPRLQEENLNGQQVTLPDAASGKVAVLAIGFSRASARPKGNYAKRIREDLGKNTGVVLYQIGRIAERSPTSTQRRG